MRLEKRRRTQDKKRDEECCDKVTVPEESLPLEDKRDQTGYGSQAGLKAFLQLLKCETTSILSLPY